MTRQIFERHSDIKFHENLSCGNVVIPCWRTDRRTDITKLTVTIHNFERYLIYNYLFWTRGLIMFLGYCGTPFRHSLSHITADRNVLPLSPVHLLLVKSELLDNFTNSGEKILFVSPFQCVRPRWKKLALRCTEFYEILFSAFLIKSVLKIWFVKYMGYM